MPVLIMPLRRIMKVTNKTINLSKEKLRELFFNAPCVFRKEKTEKELLRERNGEEIDRGR